MQDCWKRRLWPACKGIQATNLAGQMSDAFGQASICLGSVINEIGGTVLLCTSVSCRGEKGHSARQPHAYPAVGAYGKWPKMIGCATSWPDAVSLSLSAKIIF